MCLAVDIAKSYKLRAWYFGANDGRPQRLTKMTMHVSQLDILGHETNVPPNRDLCATSTLLMPWDFHVFDIFQSGACPFLFSCLKRIVLGVTLGWKTLTSMTAFHPQ